MDQNNNTNQGVKSESSNLQADMEVRTKSVPPNSESQVVNKEETTPVNAQAADAFGSVVGNENASQTKLPKREDDQIFQNMLNEKEKKGQKIVLYIAIILFSLSIIGLIAFLLIQK